MVANKIRPGDVIATWDHRPAVRASRARAILDELAAAKAANDELNRRRIDEQLDRERDARLAQSARLEATSRSRLRGPYTFGPSDAEEPAWASAPTREDDES